MKKFINYICIVALLAAVSCNRTEQPEFPSAKGDLTFHLLSSDLVTRATEPGDDTYNENTIETIDWFFFSDAAGETILLEGREGTTGTTLTDPTLSFDTSEAAYDALKKTFYAYFLVNYPGTVAHDGSLKLSDILQLPVTGTDFEAASTPVFVMDSYEKADTDGLILMKPSSKDEARTQTVTLTRVAAKMVLNINVAHSVAGMGDEVWTPDIYTQGGVPQLQAYFVNALKTSTVAGTPAVRNGKFVASTGSFSDSDKYFSYSTSHAWVDNGANAAGTADSLSTTPFYTYPQAFKRAKNGEPYFKIFLPWTSSKKGTNNFYYKVLVPGLDTLKRNSFYHVNLDLDVIGGTTDDYFLAASTYLVAEWFSPGDMGQTGISSARFLDIAQDTIKFYNQDTMAVAVTSSHVISASITSATKYDFKNNRSVTVSSSDYSIVSYGKNTFTIKHNLDREISHSTFDCSLITFQVRVIHEDNGQQKVETVTVIQYPPIYIEQELSNSYAFVNGTGATLGSESTHSSTPVYNNNNPRNSIGSLPNRAYINDATTGNRNRKQYTVYVSVLPEDSSYTIGDPRGNARGSNGKPQNLTGLTSNYRPTATNSQNIIAPAFKMASSYGRTADLEFDRAEERCAAYQENGYPAGRWRVPTVAEIEFVISLSEYEHIPALYTTGHASGYTARTSRDYPNGYRIFDSYWAGGMYAYAGSVYKNESGAATAESLTSSNLYDSPVYRKQVNGTYYFYTSAVRCVYDVWYWGDNPLNNNGQQVSKTGNRATNWLGYNYMD
ncbi:MAG: hypothetical protein IJ654_08965 [Bacteroidales bacterium]|nr:hypothetical protein [Bacteroidales bacterium]